MRGREVTAVAELVTSEKPSTPSPVPYETIDLEQLWAFPDPIWLVDHWCMRQSVTLITGESESFKTFLAMDLAVKAVDPGFSHFGPHWIDRSTVGGGPLKVMYIIGESTGGAKFRWAAIFQHHKLADTNPRSLIIRKERVDLFKDPVRVKATIELHDPDIVIFDTWSRNTYGMDENNKKDVDIALEVANDLKMGGSRGGRSIVFLHHPNKAGSPYRGHSSLLNDTDIMIGVTRLDLHSEERVAPFYTKIKSERQKETDDFIPYWAKLDGIHLNDLLTGDPLYKNDGSPVKSLVITAFDEEPATTETVRAYASPKAETVLQLLKDNPDGLSIAEVQKQVFGKAGTNAKQILTRALDRGDVIKEGHKYFYDVIQPELDRLEDL